MTTPRELLAQNASQAQLSSYFVDKVGLISVKSFGAKGDGTTNDTAAIIATKTYAAANGLVSIFFPHGTYVVDAGTGTALSGYFLWGDNTTITGDTITIYQIGANVTGYPASFIGLPDSPTSYTGQSGKVLAVNSTEDALEFVDLLDSPIFTGTPTAPAGTDYTAERLRNVILSTTDPVSGDGADGSIWIKYIP
jgi:hypothetical protein